MLFGGFSIKIFELIFVTKKLWTVWYALSATFLIGEELLLLIKQIAIEESKVLLLFMRKDAIFIAAMDADYPFVDKMLTITKSGAVLMDIRKRLLSLRLQFL